MTKQAEQPFSPLVGAVLTQMIEDSAATSKLLQELNEARILDRDAELYAIRTGVSRLLDSPYMPTSDAIHEAVFYPDWTLVESYRQQRHRETT